MPFPFSDTVTVRYSDTDAQGHLYFANYLVFADEVAGAYMHQLGYTAMTPDTAPCYIFTVNINCDYLGECKAFDVVRVSGGYTRLGNTSAELGFEMANEADGETLVRGTITQVFVDKSSRKPCAIPECLRKAIMEEQPELVA